MNNGSINYKYKPELFSDTDIDKLIEKIYNNCMEINCDDCPHLNEVEEGTCKADIIMDLWRKWQNANNNFTELEYILQERREKLS